MSKSYPSSMRVAGVTVAASLVMSFNFLAIHPAAAVLIPLTQVDPGGGPALDLGWQADVPVGVALTGITVDVDAKEISFTKEATFNAFTPLSIVFIHDGRDLPGLDETFFMVKEKIRNMTDQPWDDFHMTITDANDNTSNTGAVHPRRAHFHPRSWDSGDPAVDYLVLNLPATNVGTYLMDLQLKDGHDPTGIGDELTGQFVRMHDIREVGAGPMRFTLTELPSALPAPATLLLFAAALGLGAVARRRG